jgi:hypothetical protein
MPLAPKVLDPQQLAHADNRSFAAMRAYAASKLCNLLTARAQSDEARDRLWRESGGMVGLLEEM